ncbi:signal recognition particle-docking protein FtsY [Salinibacter ruber]|uniref:signal recognition particle-docking protein FtsY n=1 Tax=Salinibacter ruber TaxID=146919 RepID=UPI0021697FF6|nr:signal recognition particle-docking protein FtsY [Salinibacter ruber]MCS4041441.1 fused signal recognition particle receptor [Salinibacter ruber]
MGFLDTFTNWNDDDEQEKLEEGLDKTRDSFFGKLDRMVRGKDTVDAEVLDELEEILITSDVGVDTTLDIIDHVEARVAQDQYVSAQELNGLIRDEIARLMLEGSAERPADFDAPLPNQPHVIMVVGVNGVGKTTTIGKMAHKYRQAGKSVLMGAGDTFRAAAIEQLEIWADRADVPLIKQKHGADPAAVAYDTIEAAEARDADVAIVDTAGRLHTKGGLMDELAKMKRVMGRKIPEAPHEVLLVLDASTGQNALRQAEEFIDSVDVTGLALTKLDGTAKGGVVIGVSHQFQVPVKYIGVGEGIDDLQVFDRKGFVEGLFKGVES